MELGLAHLLCVDTTELGLDFCDGPEQDRDRTIIPSGKYFFIFNSKSTAPIRFRHCNDYSRKSQGYYPDFRGNAV